MSDPILILYPYMWIDRFMSCVTSAKRAQAFDSGIRSAMAKAKRELTGNRILCILVPLDRTIFVIP